MSDYDFIQLYKKLEVLDRELRELRVEVGEIKDSLKPKKQWVPQWEENLSDNESFEREFK